MSAILIMGSWPAFIRNSRVLFDKCCFALQIAPHPKGPRRFDDVSATHGLHQFSGCPVTSRVRRGVPDRDADKVAVYCGGKTKLPGNYANQKMQQESADPIVVRSVQ